MELNKTQNWFYIITTLAVVFILSLGSWWLYLFFKLANKLEEYDLSATEGNLVSMLQWEGVTFFVLLLALAFALFYIFFQDNRKTRSLQAFFSSLTHELKTPLASIRLQSQVLNDLLEDQQSIDPSEKEQLRKYTHRLQEDSIRLENELDKHLQLSRVERNAPLNLTSINLISFIKNEASKFPSLEYEITPSTHDIAIKADDYAFSMIIRNLIENTLKHSSSKKIFFNIDTSENNVTISYSDRGSNFTGDTKELGKLFYKHNSPQGSGLGLYLIKRLCKIMHGSFQIKNSHYLIFNLTFLRAPNE